MIYTGHNATSTRINQSTSTPFKRRWAIATGLLLLLMAGDMAISWNALQGATDTLQEANPIAATMGIPLLILAKLLATGFLAEYAWKRTRIGVLIAANIIMTLVLLWNIGVTSLCA